MLCGKSYYSILMAKYVSLCFLMFNFLYAEMSVCKLAVQGSHTF